MALDEIDKNILRILQDQGRITNNELASRIGLTATPTIERVKRLERDGYIEGYRAIVNQKKVNLGLTVFIKVMLKEHRQPAIQDFLQSIEKMPEVVACYHTTGAGDFMLKVLVRDIEDYEDFVMHKITKAPAFSRIESNMVLSIPKAESALPIH